MTYEDVVGVIADHEYLVGHNVFEDVKTLRQVMDLPERWITGEKVLDTILLARMVDENRGKGNYKLEPLLSSFANIEPWKHHTEGSKGNCVNAAEWPAEQRVERCRLDAWACRKVAEHFYAPLRHQQALVQYTHRIAATLNRVGLVGACVDLPAFESMKEKLSVELQTYGDLLRGKAAQSGINEFVPTNDSHIRNWLYDVLDLPVISRTKKTKVPSVDLTTLKNLHHEVADLLVKYNRADKLYSVNGTGLDSLVRHCGSLASDPVGWLSFRINPLGARTGRRSSTRPNSQNWPKSVRSIIRSRNPGGVIGDFDYRRLEVVLIAWIAGDERLFTAFTEGRGYLDVARDLWGKEVQEGTPEYKATKSVVLGVNYNMQDDKMARELWNKVTRFSADYEEHCRQTARVRSRYLRQHRPLVEYMDAREQELLRTNRVISYTGRVRHLPLLDGRDTPKYWHFLNQAINFPIQSLASDVTGSALIDVEEALLAEYGISYTEYYDHCLKLNAFYLTNPPTNGIIPPNDFPMPLLINEVHDDLVVDFPPEHLSRNTDLVIGCMRNVSSLRRLCPRFDLALDVSAQTAVRWAQDAM